MRQAAELEQAHENPRPQLLHVGADRARDVIGIADEGQAFSLRQLEVKLVAI